MPSPCWNNSAEWLSSSVIDSRRLQYFLAVYDHGSLGRAAAALDLTQPALSKTIHQLERELKVKLFDRTPKGLVPTVYGETLSVHARSVESEIRHAEREIGLLAGAAKGLVRIGVTPSIAATLMPQIALRIHREAPRIELAVVEGLVRSHAAAVRRGELDLVVGGWERDMGPDLATELAGVDQVDVYARADHPLAGSRLELPWLLEYPWALPPHSEFWLGHLDRAFVANGLAPPPAAVTGNSAAFLVGMVRTTDFLSYLPGLLVRRARDAGEIVRLDVPALTVEIGINITYRARSSTPASVGSVIEAVRSVCAAIT